MSKHFDQALAAVAFFCGEAISVSDPSEAMIATAAEATGFDRETVKSLYGALSKAYR